MYLKKLSVFTLLTLTSYYTIYAQENDLILDSIVQKPLTYDLNSVVPYSTKQNNFLLVKAETSGTFSKGGDNAPFWFTNNNDGIGSLNNNSAYLRTGVFGSEYLSKADLQINYGVDVIASHNLQTDFYVQQLYAQLKYKVWGLSIGAKQHEDYYLNRNLSSGNMSISNNARPIPKIEAGIPDYVQLPFTNNWIQILGGISFGKFLNGKYNEQHAADGNYAKDILYHQKFVYFKIEKQTRWNFILGLDMNTQWGGKRYVDGVLEDKGPTKFSDFLRVLVPMNGGSESSEADQRNILGNVNGSWHFVFNYNMPNYTIKAYHEHFFEDHSGFVIVKNIPDGLYGLEINTKKKQLLSTVLFEFLYTKDQSGYPFRADGTTDPRKGDNYYNHHFYNSFSYYGHTLGSPFLVSPIYNKDGSLKILNNRVVSYHLGMSGYLHRDLDYRLLLSYSRGYGTYGNMPDPVLTMFTSLLEMNYTNLKLNGWKFTGALAYDNSERWIGDNFGGNIKIAKTFTIK